MARWFLQLRLLLWKNFLIQSRRKISTIFEIILPIFFVLILLILRITTIKVKQGQLGHWDAFPLNKTIPLNKTDGKNNMTDSDLLLGPQKKLWSLAYSPNTSDINAIMMHVSEFLDIESVKAYPNEDRLAKAVVTDEVLPLAQQTFLCGIVFESGKPGDVIKYTLRFPTNSRSQFGDKKLQKVISFVPQKWYTQFVYPFTFTGMGPRNENLTAGGPPPYFREGFLSVQYGVDMAIIKSKTPTENYRKINVNLRRFPYPATIRDGFIIVIQNSLPLLLMLSLVYSALVIVKNIVYEKERKLKVDSFYCCCCCFCSCFHHR